MELRTIMAMKPLTVAAGDPVALAAAKMREANVGCLVVTDRAGVAGIITDRDLTVHCLAQMHWGHDPHECVVSDHMTAPLITAAPGTDVLEAAHLMTQHKVKRLPVLDGGELIGLVSLSDIAQAMDRPFHELLIGMGAARRRALVAV